MTRPIRRNALLAALAPLGALLLLAATIGAADAQAASFKNCRLSQSEQFPSGGKPTYNLTLRAKGVGCRTAKSVMRSFHRCRPRSGVRCSRRVLARWTCGGRRTSSIPGQFNATFSCRSGARRVAGSYQQNVPTR
ncbi:MAG TPA: hypothetical protein VM299_00975 [Solirubrobacteraceae bacterium]|nr:hypothetical protein [Solirubrobacteraceae bacterium]